VDLIAAEDVPWPVEVNPRWTASLELAERALGASVFALHAAACTGAHASLPDDIGAPDHALGKAVLFARRTVTVGDTRRWLDDPDVRDIPAPGSAIRRGSPICTILARGRSAADCEALLVRRAAALHAALEAPALRGPRGAGGGRAA
jgi:predicted ATP-grasp superfamily ATP-dependent carboligase